MSEVQIEEVRRFMEESLIAVGAPENEAKLQADLLLYADTVGHFSHGLNRLELYVNDIKGGLTCPERKPVVLKESAATAWVDGMDALGATTATFCMDLAIKKAKESGVGWVSAKRTNHFGMAGYWAIKAEREGLIGMAFTNSSPVMVPTRSKQSACGTNPISMAAPALDEDSLVVDMATTAAAMGKIEVQIHKNEPIPEGWALGPDGNTITDSQLAFKTAKLLPLGGFEGTSGYKGFCLSAMVEMLCSGLSGSNPSYKVPAWTFDQDTAPNLGQCFVAIDPECFAPGFAERAAGCLQHWRNLQPPFLSPLMYIDLPQVLPQIIDQARDSDTKTLLACLAVALVRIVASFFLTSDVDPSSPVLAPGDKERNIREITLRRGTIIYPQGQIDSYHLMAQKIGIKPLAVK